jgi:hypothetical protein
MPLQSCEAANHSLLTQLKCQSTIALAVRLEQLFFNNSSNVVKFFERKVVYLARAPFVNGQKNVPKPREHSGANPGIKMARLDAPDLQSRSGQSGLDRMLDRLAARDRDAGLMR